MDLRLPGFCAAVLLLVTVRLLPLLGRPAREPIFASPAQAQWSWRKLMLASFLTLFAELAMIRWIATEVRIFAYVKNLALLLCFLGFGLGCALAKSRLRWQSSAVALLGLLMVVRLPHYGERVVEGLSESLGAAQAVAIWGTGTSTHWLNFLLAAAITGLLLLMIACVFIPLGQIVSRQIDLAPRPLLGYSWNLAASLAGILAFFAICERDLSPSVWLAAIFVGFALLQASRKAQLAMLCFVILAVLLLHDVSTASHFTIWTPYQQLEIERQTFRDGDFGRTVVKVNHTGYQAISDLSGEFLARHPGLVKEPVDENPYNLPSRFATPHPRVLIVGSGTGNDVAAAVRNGSSSVDAVEIDPAILRLGMDHPEHPYQSPLVSVHTTDARAFLKRASAGYDLVVFGLLDSHTQLSDYSNMRIDNFVYTEESFREVKRLLAPDGVLFLKFQVNQPWLGRRLQEMLSNVFGGPPVVFQAGSSYTVPATCFAISPSARVEEELKADPRLRQLVSQNPPDFLTLPPVAITTDDWPYLYQQGRWIPGVFFSVSVLVAILAVGLYWQIPEARQNSPSLFFFSMGAGFLLLETQVISRLALYFGTTWQVNGIVIAAILSALLAANAVVDRQKKPWSQWAMLGGLLGGLALAYFLPFSRIPGSASVVGWMAAAIFAVPVFFAGLLFASEFRCAASQSAALGANMLGAVVGGLLENLSLIVGLKALLLVAGLLYALAGWGLHRRASARAAALSETAAVR